MRTAHEFQKSPGCGHLGSTSFIWTCGACLKNGSEWSRRREKMEISVKLYNLPVILSAHWKMTSLNSDYTTKMKDKKATHFYKPSNTF